VQAELTGKVSGSKVVSSVIMADDTCSISARGIIVPRFVLIGYFIFQNSTPSSFSSYLGLLLPFFTSYVSLLLLIEGGGLQQQMIFANAIVLKRERG